ncbi:TetR/AcrR family transcriptional regulator [Bailinhaonella thermotolerans]|uniref:TetR family transcriptional regulator n=1 Tax=Bailinhaonella thermotolerans TaxID=1070861 RepID=A0A3A4ADX1_9ACTN|nr:TetR family transcriptional regulator [Bailinhaonella thermotolerans]RJL26489.1 TetR family transcriptional regulator [Bailinhaonella thermotolerans]
MTTSAESADTRARILAAAKRLFAARGYAATSLADIAAAVGLSKTAVAYHFHPKDRLAEELLTPAAEEILTLLGRDFGGDRRAFLTELAEFAVRHREVIRLLLGDPLTGGFTGGTADTRAAEVIARPIATFRDEIHARLTGGDPSPELATRAWCALGAIYSGVLWTMDHPEDVVVRTITASALGAYEA